MPGHTIVLWQRLLSQRGTWSVSVSTFFCLGDGTVSHMLCVNAHAWPYHDLLCLRSHVCQAVVFYPHSLHVCNTLPIVQSARGSEAEILRQQLNVGRTR